MEPRDYDAQEALRRQRLAIELSKYLPWCLLTGAVLLGAIWAAAPVYVQFAGYSAVLIANAAVIWVSGRLFAAGRSTLASVLFVGSFTAHASLVPMVVAETLLEMTTGFMLVALLGGMVLGARRVGWVAVFAVPALVSSVVYGPTLQSRYFPALPETTSSVVSVTLMAFQMGIDVVVLYLVLATQERLYREAKVAADEALALRDRVEQALAQSTAVLQNIADGLVAVGSDGRVQASNPALSRLLALPADLLDQPVSEAVPGAVSALAHASRETGQVQRAQLALPDERVGAAIASPMRVGEGVGERVVGSVVVVRDVTAEKEAERVRSQFLANMSHEIRTPMNAVIGMTELLQRTELTGRQQRYVDVIGSCGESLLALINDILDLSKIEAGRFQLVDQDFDLPDATERTVAMLAKQGQVKGLAVTCRVDPSVPRAVRGDAERLRQILINLIGNAIKFTDAGGVHVEVRLEGEGDDHALVRFEVRDTGIGIAPEHQAGLFELFTQVDPSSTRSHGGTGLGTTIAKQLAELMGGQIGVRSALGEGSTFWFTARFGQATSLPAAGPAPRQAQGLRVLVVDRSATDRELLEAYLSAWGMSVVTAASAADALALLETQPFRVVLVGADLADVRAAALAATVRGRWSVALVALGEIEDEAAFDAQVPKPVRQSTLLDTLMGLLAGKRVDGRAAASRPAPGRDTLLLAEDNPINQELAVDMLREIGYRVEVVETGRAAVDAIAAGDFAAVLMDCQMPVMDGYEAAREIRRRWPDRAIPLIALTAHAMKEDRDRALEAGMDDYLTKPVTFAVLREALVRWAGLGAVEVAQEAAPDAPAAPSDLPPALANKPNVRRLFVKHVPTQLDTIAQALDGGQPEAIGRAAHSLKGALWMCGLSELGELCKRVEAAGAAGDVDEARRLFGPLQAQVTALVRTASVSESGG